MANKLFKFKLPKKEFLFIPPTLGLDLPLAPPLSTWPYHYLGAQVKNNNDKF